MSDDEHVVVLAEHRVSVPGEHEIIEVRVLTPQEDAEIRKAAALVTTVAASADFRRVQELIELNVDRVDLIEVRDEPGAHEIEACLLGVAALVEAQGRFLDAMESWSVDLAQAPAVNAARHELDALKLSPEWELVRAVAERGIPIVRDRQGIVGASSGPGRFEPLKTVILASYSQTQAAFAFVLTAIADEVRTAGLRLRELNVECPEGVPTLVTGTEMLGGRGTLPYDLPLHLVSEALRLTRVAGPVSASEPAVVEVAAVRSDMPDDADEGGDGPLDGSGAVKTHEPDQSDTPERHDPRDSESDVPRSPVLDLAGLLGFAATLNTDLEHAWSGALERSATDEGIAAQMAMIRAALAAFQRQAEIDRVVVEEFPPGGKLLSALEVEPERAVQLMAIAQIKALINVTAGLEPLADPTTVQLTFDGEGNEKLRRFWVSGAFAQMSARLELLRDLLPQDGRSEEQRRMNECFRLVRLARASWFAGDPEASLFHGARALAAYFQVAVHDLQSIEALQSSGQENLEVGLRALATSLAGNTALALATLTAPTVVDAAVNLTTPSSAERSSMTGDELYDLISRDVPFEPLTDE